MQDAGGQPATLSRFAIRFINTYRRAVSSRLNASCRYEPSCSKYGLQAFQRYGFWCASAKTTWRLLRCNLWARGPQFDPP